MPEILDGTGSGNRGKVDANNRLHVRAVNTPDDEEATNNEDSFTINSGLLTLTTANESAVLYVKNTGDREVHINAIVGIFGPSTGGVSTDTIHIRFKKNPTGGTIVSDATNAPIISNRNFGSSKTFPGNAYIGGEGKTETGSSAHIESLISPGNRVSFKIDEILTKGDSISVTYEPPDSNTNIKVMADIVCHLRDKNE